METQQMYRFMLDGQQGTVSWDADDKHGIFTSTNGAVFTVRATEVQEVKEHTNE